jgi:flagellar biosynthetic protein FliR
MPIPDPVFLLLVLARVAGLLVAAPILGHLLLPRLVRAGLAIVLALALAPVVAAPPALPTTLLGLVGALAMETAFGLLLGFIAELVFAGVQLGAQLAGMQIGFGLDNLIDPGNNSQSTVVAHWYRLLALLVFLALDVHHLLLEALIASFRTAPPGSLAAGAFRMDGVVAAAGDIFALGVRIAAPVLIALLLTNAVLGVIARTIPQVNVFVVGFPLNVGVGLVVMGAALPFTFRLLTSRFAALEPALGGLVRGLAHG